MKSGISLREILIAIGCAILVTVLFCLRQGYVGGDLRQAIMLSLFAMPFSLAVTVVLLLPTLAVMKRLGATNAIFYTVAPAVIVLCVYMAPILLNPTPHNVLRFEGRSLIQNGRVIWENIGWMALYHAEPALWAALAGLLFWLLVVKWRASSENTV